MQSYGCISLAMFGILSITTFVAHYTGGAGKSIGNVPSIRTQESGRQRNLLWFLFRNRNNNEIRCNGHANLCAKPVNEIMFATMHNANNAVADGSLILPNHGLNIKTALDKGFRGINWDFAKCLDKVTLVHASCVLATKVPLKVVMQQILDFLNDNPHEVLLLPTEIVEDSFLLDTPTIAEVDAVFQEVPGWKDKLYDHPGPGNPWPTVQELIDTDKRLIYLFYRGETCTKGVNCPVGFHPYFQ